MSIDLLDEIEEIAREQIDSIRSAVKLGFALDFEDIRKLETLTRVIVATRAEARRLAKEGNAGGMTMEELEDVIRKGMAAK